MAREIPYTAVEIQTGLYQNLVVGRYITYSELYSAEGYCFYDNTVSYYDEEGNEIPNDQVPATMRMYYQYCSTPETAVEDLNARFVSVPVDPSYEIASTIPGTEVA